MGITAQDIQNEGFEHSLRGYDVEQVDVFLERVADEVDVMNTTIGQLEAQVASLQEELAGAAPADSATPEELEQAIARAESAEAKAAHADTRLAEAKARIDDAQAKLADALARAEKAEAALEPLQAELAQKNELDSAISQAFISAQRSADNLMEEARAEGERIYRESEGKAREFIREALQKKAALYAEIDALQKSAESFRASYIALVDGFADEAKNKFADMEPPVISDEMINELLPDIDSLEPAEQGAPEDEDEQPEPAKPEPKVDPASIPSIDISGLD